MRRLLAATTRLRLARPSSVPIGPWSALTARHLSTTPPSGPPHPFDSFLNGNSAPYIEDMYHAWKANPESVHASWQSVFKRMDGGALPGQAFAPPPTINAGESLSTSAVPAGGSALSTGGEDTSFMLKVMQLIHAYQLRGHNVSDLDPLGLYDADLDGSTPPDLELENYGFTEADMDKPLFLGGLMQSGFLSIEADKPMTLREVVDRLRDTYSNKIGVEYMHIWDHEQVNWIREQIETPEKFQFTKQEKLRMLDRLCWSDHFEVSARAPRPMLRRHATAHVGAPSLAARHPARSPCASMNGVSCGRLVGG